MPEPPLQDPSNSNAAAFGKSLGSNLPDDPTERSTGEWGVVMNNRWTPAPRRSVLKADLEFFYPDVLEYYEDRRTGKIQARSFEDWGERVSLEERHKLYNIEHGKIKRVFFEVDYNRGFTGRGVPPGGAMERPGLLGPRNEKIEEIAGPVGGLSYEQGDRPLWQAVDDKSGCPSEISRDVEEVGPFGKSKDDDDVGPFGETIDDEEVGPFGETRDGDDGLRQDYDDGDQQRGEKVTDAEDMNNLVQSTANTGAASTSTTSSTILFNESGASLTPSSHTLSSTPPTRSRKRTRDSEEDAKDEESPSQQKRRRMDNALGIVRQDANAASNPQSIGAVMTPDVQQSRKRARSSDDNLEESRTRPGPKRLRLHVQPRWNTAHGINSNGANIGLRGMCVSDVTGELVHFYLPSRTSSPYRPLTERAKEDLRVYIQDYGVQDWEALAKSMNRTVEELHIEYLEYIMARNIEAGRHEMAGIPPAFPDLAPPPPPPPLKKKPKAKSFPEVTKDGGMVDPRRNASLGTMNKKPGRPVLTSSFSKDTEKGFPQAEEEEHGSEMEEGEILE